MARLSKFSLISLEDLEALVETRLDEAEVLYKAGRFLGAVYLAGYAVECLLKVAICRTLGWSELKGTFRTHDLELLMLHSGFDSRLQQEGRIVESFAQIRKIWRLEEDSLRYWRADQIDQETADLFFACVTDASRGVLPWLRRMIS